MKAERWNFLIACANDNMPAEKINFRDEEEIKEYDALLKEQDKYEKMTGVRPKFEPTKSIFVKMRRTSQIANLSL